MSVRRLAESSVQPPSFAFSNDNLRWAERKIAEYPPGRQQSAVIPILWRAQEQEGWVTRAAIEYVAKMLGMAYIRVLEVATFYTQFLLKPVGSRAHIMVCGTTPCMLRGAEALTEFCQHRIHHDPLTVSADGTLSWEEVECLGACVNAPMVMIGNDTYEDLTVERFEEIVEAFAAGRGDTIPPGTQIERVTSAPEGGLTTLTRADASTPHPVRSSGPPAAEQEPTNAGRKREVGEEAAPALKGPSKRKVAVAKAEGERAKASGPAGDGTPSKTMRAEATGAESPAGKTDGGKAAGKAIRPAPGDGAGAAGTAPQPPGAGAQPGTPGISPSADAGAPMPLFAAPAGARDDLKLITGVGPALERTMNSLGITTWRQVADLTPEDIARVEGRLNFRGRVTRDNWLAQAKALADGGVEEYRRVFGREPK